MRSEATHTRLGDTTSTEELYSVTGSILATFCAIHLQESDLTKMCYQLIKRRLDIQILIPG